MVDDLPDFGLQITEKRYRRLPREDLQSDDLHYGISTPLAMPSDFVQPFDIAMLLSIIQAYDWFC